MEKHPVEKLKDHFSAVDDPRSDNVSHLLIDVITIAICALASGADGWVEVEAYGKAKLWWLRQFLELPHGIPSHDTFGRVFAIIDPQQFRESFLRCAKAIMVSAWSSENGIVLGQEKVRDKSNEITAIQALLELLDLANCISINTPQ